MSGRGWIGVDLDGTLAHYESWVAPGHIGVPIGGMLFRVKKWLADGHEVRIFTARCWPHAFIAPGMELRDLPIIPGAAMRASAVDDSAIAIKAIRAWCLEHLGQELAITCVKDYAMIELYDDRCVQVHPNTGELVGKSTRSL